MSTPEFGTTADVLPVLYASVVACLDTVEPQVDFLESEDRVRLLTPDEQQRVAGVWSQYGMDTPDAIELSTSSELAGVNGFGEVIPGQDSASIDLRYGSIKTTYYCTHRPNGTIRISKSLEADDVLPAPGQEEELTVQSIVDARPLSPEEKNARLEVVLSNIALEARLGMNFVDPLEVMALRDMIELLRSTD